MSGNISKFRKEKNMQPKGKTIRSKSDEATPKAIVHHLTVWDALDKATKEMSPADCRFVQEQVTGIQGDLKIMYEKKDSIAGRLAAIHSKGGKELFASLAENVFPRFGMSKSSCYRLLESAQLLRSVIPDPQVRQALLGRFEKPLTTTDAKSGAVKLTPAFEKAIKSIEAPKPDSEGTLSPEQIDAYTGSLIAEARKLGKTAKKSPAALKQTAIERIEDAFSAFMQKYGTDEANQLLNGLEEILETEQKTIQGAPKGVTPKPVSAPTQKIINSAVATKTA